MADNQPQSYVKLYFSIGLTQREILNCLASINGIIISRRTLQRLLKRAGLYRRKEYSDILEVSLFLVQEVEKSSRLHGYRFMHQKCIQNGYIVTQQTIRLLLQIIDPEGVQERRTGTIKRRLYNGKGPNFMWHIDSYDKLKPYGICVNAAIDGFSRCIVWIRVYRTSSDPRIIGSYFMKAVKERGGCPSRIRTDFGTENVRVRQIQEALRFDDNDEFARNSFIYGSSTHNVRIESWWAFLRRHNTQFWIEKFHDLKETGLFSGDYADKSLIQFVFTNIIQREFNEITSLWNNHRIRPNRRQDAPHGRPLLMYMLPHLWNTSDYLRAVEAGAVCICEEECSMPGPYPCDKLMFDICCMLMEERNLAEPRTPEEGFFVYNELRREIRANL